MESDDFVESEGNVMDLNAGKFTGIPRSFRNRGVFLQKVLLQTKLWKMDSLKHYQVEVVWVKWRIPGGNLISRMEKPPPGSDPMSFEEQPFEEHLH